MKSLKLKTVHRLLVRGLLNDAGASGGSLSEMYKLMKLVGKIDFSMEEREALNLRLENNMWLWNPDSGADTEKEFELSDEDAKIVRDLLEKKDKDKKILGSEAAPLVELASQLDYSFEG